MPFNINTFKSHIDKYGYIQNNKFEVYIRPPNALTNVLLNTGERETSVSNIVKMLKFRAEDVIAPGIALMTADINRYGIGPTQKYPINAQFGEIGLSFICDKYAQVWGFWHEWEKLVFEFTGTESSVGRTNNRIPTYTTRFKDDYGTTMQIIVYNNQGFDVLKMNLYDAYPIAVRDNNLSWSENSELLTINVNMTFKEYTIEKSTLQAATQRESEFSRNSVELNSSTNIP